MTRHFRLAAVLGLLVVVGLAWPSVADAQRRGGSRGGGGHAVAVPRTHAPVYARSYSRSYSRSYVPYYRSYYRPSYSYRPYYYSRSYGYSPYFYSPYTFGISFGLGWGWGGYAPSYAYPYPYYPSPYSYSPYYDPYSSYGYPAPSSTYGYAQPAPAPYQTQMSAPAYQTDTRGDFGTLSLRVTPGDAAILIDGAAWDRPQGDDRFSIDLTEGPHRVEVRRQGYTTYVRTIDVSRGRATVLNVGLTTSQGSGPGPVARTVPLRNYR